MYVYCLLQLLLMLLIAAIIGRHYRIQNTEWLSSVYTISFFKVLFWKKKKKIPRVWCPGSQCFGVPGRFSSLPCFASGKKVTTAISVVSVTFIDHWVEQWPCVNGLGNDHVLNHWSVCDLKFTEYPQRKDFLETGLREFLCAVLKQTWASAVKKKSD